MNAAIIISKCSQVRQLHGQIRYIVQFCVHVQLYVYMLTTSLGTLTQISCQSLKKNTLLLFSLYSNTRYNKCGDLPR